MGKKTAFIDKFDRRKSAHGSANQYDPAKRFVLRRQGDRSVYATYDAARTTDDNRRHWSAADGLSSVDQNSRSVRRTIYTRSRYEYANNPHCKGMVDTLASDTVGRGPRLQVIEGTQKDCRNIERMWHDFTQEIDLTQLLLTTVTCRVVDGEAFMVNTTDDSPDRVVSLRPVLVDCDRVTSQLRGDRYDGWEDGIYYSDSWVPQKYRITNHKPTDPYYQTESTIVKSSDVMHLYRIDRAGQIRGVSEIQSALRLLAELRRYINAVLASAESAADIAGVLYTDQPPMGEAENVEKLDRIEMEQRAFVSVPAGWKLCQIKAEQPTAECSTFVDTLLNAIARCLSMPFNVVAGNSSGYNYASGRLDFRGYETTIDVSQHRIENVIMDRLFESFWSELVLSRWRKAGAILKRRPPRHHWFWKNKAQIDAMKEANAQRIRLKNMTTTLAAEYAVQGKDWEQELEQIGRELEAKIKMYKKWIKHHTMRERAKEMGFEE